jgi:hypothetical protein
MATKNSTRTIPSGGFIDSRWWPKVYEKMVATGVMKPSKQGNPLKRTVPKQPLNYKRKRITGDLKYSYR